MRFPSFFLPIIFISLFQISLAQTGQIKGIIVDENGEGIPFANVVLLSEPDSIQVNGTATTYNGNFTIKPIDPGQYSLRASYLGNFLFVDGVQVNANKTTYLDTITISTSMQLDAVRVNYEEAPVDVGYTQTGVTMSRERITKMPGNGNGQQWNREAYAHIDENNYKSPYFSPLSTFSIDVDRASYSNIRRMINREHRLPPAGAVRIEEMVNYFNFNYPEPTDVHPFAIHTEIGPCHWNKKHKLAMIGIQGERVEVDSMPPNNLVFLIDVSGSMRSMYKLDLVKKSLRLLVNNMRPEDKITLVVYAGAAGLVLEPTPGDQKNKIMNAIDNLRAGGSTAGGAGIKLAYKKAMESFINDGNNRVILATDGDFNVGTTSESALVDMIEEKREHDIYLSVLGFGTGNYQDARMEQLADHGNGNYAYIDNLSEARKMLVEEMGGTLITIAKDVKIQVEFNPNVVQAYRLVGYENRTMPDEDFNNDQKDAGEIGSGHSVTAIYEIIPVGVKSAFTKDGVNYLKYQHNEVVANEGELMNVKVRYKPPEKDESKLIEQAVNNKEVSEINGSEHFRFASAVAAFGLLLRDSDFKGSANFEETIRLAQEAKGEDEEGYRAEFVQIVKTAKMLHDEIAARD